METLKNIVIKNSTGTLSTEYLGNGVFLIYSYKTCIAFVKDDQPAVTLNAWGTTTGKHLYKVREALGVTKEECFEYPAFLKHAENVFDEKFVKRMFLP